MNSQKSTFKTVPQGDTFLNGSCWTKVFKHSFSLCCMMDFDARVQDAFNALAPVFGTGVMVLERIVVPAHRASGERDARELIQSGLPEQCVLSRRAAEIVADSFLLKVHPDSYWPGRDGEVKDPFLRGVAIECAAALYHRCDYCWSGRENVSLQLLDQAEQAMKLARTEKQRDAVLESTGRLVMKIGSNIAVRYGQDWLRKYVTLTGPKAMTYLKNSLELAAS
jgi:hypothetical protein